MYHRHGHMGIPWTVANGCGRLRTVANVNATSSEHILNRQTPRVKRGTIATHSGKTSAKLETPMWEVITRCQDVNRNHAWFVITSSLLAFLGEARSWNIQTISGSQTANAQIPGFQVPPCVVFFSLLLKAEVSARNFSASPCVFKIAFWEILKPRLPLPIFHYTNILIYPKWSQYISTDSLVCPNYPTTFLGLTKLYREVFHLHKLSQCITCLPYPNYLAWSQ